MEVNRRWIYSSKSLGPKDWITTSCFRSHITMLSIELHLLIQALKSLGIVCSYTMTWNYACFFFLVSDIKILVSPGLFFLHNFLIWICYFLLCAIPSGDYKTNTHISEQWWKLWSGNQAVGGKYSFFGWIYGTYCFLRNLHLKFYNQ